MIIKPAKFKKCRGCGSRKRLSDDVFGCDGCKKPIPDGAEYLEATVFNDGAAGNAGRITFCSWKCAMSAIRKVKSNYFVTLPYLHYDKPADSATSAAAFFREIDK